MQVGRHTLLLKYGGNLKCFYRFVAGWVRECMLTWTIVECTFISMTLFSVSVSCWFITKGYWKTHFFWNMTPRHGASGSWPSQWTWCFHLLGLTPRCSLLVLCCGIWHVTACCTKGLEGAASVFKGPSTCEPRNTKEVSSFETLETAHPVTQRQNRLLRRFCVGYMVVTGCLKKVCIEVGILCCIWARWSEFIVNLLDRS